MMAFSKPTGPITVYSLIFDSGPSTYLSNSTRADVGRQKRSPESDHSCRGRQSDRQCSLSELLDVAGTGAWDMRYRLSAVQKNRFRHADSVFWPSDASF